MMRRRQREPDDATQGDLHPPSSPGSASVWVGSSRPAQHVSTIHSIHSTGSTGSREGQDSVRHGSASSSEGEYVLISVKNSVSDSEPGSRKNSGTRTASHSSAAHVSETGHGSRNSSNSSSIDPFSPTSPRGTDPSIYGQNAGNTGNLLGTASLGNHGHVSDVSYRNGVQNLALAGNGSNAGSFVSSPVPFAAGNFGSNQNAALGGNTGQNAAFFPTTGGLSSMALSSSSAGNILAANPGLLYSGGTFSPAANSGMTMLPQGGYDPSALLLQQQYGLSPDLLATGLGQTLPQSQATMTQNLDLLQTSLAQSQTAAPSWSLPQAQPTPQSLSFLQAQAALSQAQPLPPNLNLLQAQTLLQNLSLTQAGTAPQNLNLSFSQAGGAAQNLNFPQVQNPDLTQAQAMAQNLGMLQLQAAALQQQQLPLSRSNSVPDSPDSARAEDTIPSMGHSFEVLSAIVAANQAKLSTPAQSPTTPEMSPAVISPQLARADSTSGLPPSLTGRGSVDLGNHHHHHEIVSPETCTTPTGMSSYLQGSSSLDNGDDQTTSGLGSSVSSSISDSNPTSPNTDLYSMTSEDKGVVLLVQVQPCYDKPWDKEACVRCGRKVYTMEKVGPVKEVLYHKTCFTCVACHTQLNLKTFHHNDADLADLNVYCLSHKPAARPKPLDASAVGIKRALTVPRPGRVNEQIRGGPAGRSIDLDSVSMRSALHAPAPDLQASIKQREGAWFREERKYERMPPQDVVRHDEQQYEGSLSLYSSQR